MAFEKVHLSSGHYVIKKGPLWYAYDPDDILIAEVGCWIVRERALSALTTWVTSQGVEEVPVATSGKQSRLGSFLEACINTFSGFLLSLLLWVFVVVPVWELPVTMGENLLITGMFTALSIFRGYFWRRFFANTVHLKMLQWFKEKKDENNE